MFLPADLAGPSFVGRKVEKRRLPEKWTSRTYYQCSQPAVIAASERSVVSNTGI